MSYPTVGFSGSSAAESAVPQGVRLTPLSTGQILDRIFALYRSRFTLFAGLAVFPAAVSLVVGLLRIGALLATHTPLMTAGTPSFTAGYLINMGIGAVGGLISFCVYGLSIAATNWCISKIYLGEPATMKAGFDFSFRHWFRYIVMGIVQAWFAMWMPSLVLALVVGAVAALVAVHAMAGFASGALLVLAVIGYIVWLVINFIRVSLAIPACVIEELPLRASIRRSRKLLVSRKVRIFLLGLFLGALYMVFFAILTPAAVILLKMGPNGFLIYMLATLLLTFLFGVLVTPIGAIGLCLFYFDERVRREGFDIEYLMSHSVVPPEPGVALPAAPEAPPSL